MSFVEKLSSSRRFKCIRTIGKPIIWDLELRPLYKGLLYCPSGGIVLCVCVWGGGGEGGVCARVRINNVSY